MHLASSEVVTAKPSFQHLKETASVQHYCRELREASSLPTSFQECVVNKLLGIALHRIP